MTNYLTPPLSQVLFSSWRDSEGKLKFALTLGDVRQVWRELLSIVAGITLTMHEQYASEADDDEGTNIVDFDTWVHSSERSQRVQRLAALVDAAVIPQGLYGAMRTFDLQSFMSFLRLMGEDAAASGGDK